MKKFIAILLCFNMAFAVSHAQNGEPTSFTEISTKGLPSIKIEPVTPRTPSRAPVGLTYYSDRGVFDAANPGLPIEDWTSGVVGPSDICTGFSPLDALSFAPCFSSGDILPGIEFNTSDMDDYVLLTTGFLSTPFNVLGPNTFTDNSQFIFDPPVSAVGMDFILSLISSPAVLNIDIYDETGALLASTTSPAPAVAQSFWGVSSDTPIGKIDLSSTDSAGAELFGNVAFGNSASVPIANWAILFGVLLIGTFIVVRYRKRLA